MVNVFALIVGGGISAVGFSALIPITRGTGYIANNANPNAIPTPLELISMRWRDLITEDSYKEMMKLNGFGPEWTNIMFNGAQQLLNVSELVTAKRRGIIGEGELKAMLRRHRFPAAVADQVEAILEFRPGVNDLIRFAVREVFSPEIRERFGLDKEFPDEILPFTEELGFREEDARKFWASHWELPSVSAGNEMFHRLNDDPDPDVKFSVEDFDKLIKAKDFSEFWRPKIRAILFRLPTRVDIRRMLRHGIITEAESTAIYRKIGYKEKDAKNLTKLGLSIGQDNDRELSRSLITKAFILGEINKSVAIELLGKIGFTGDNAILIIKLEEIQTSERLIEDQVDLIQSQFVNGIIDRTTFFSELDAIGMVTERRDLIIVQGERQRAKKTSIPSKGDVEKFLSKGIITEPIARDKLLQLNFKEEDVNLYIDLWSTV